MACWRTVGLLHLAVSAERKEGAGRRDRSERRREGRRQGGERGGRRGRRQGGERGGRRGRKGGGVSGGGEEGQKGEEERRRHIVHEIVVYPHDFKKTPGWETCNRWRHELVNVTGAN